MNKQPIQQKITAHYTDVLFREKHVRFIAISNGVDSLNQESNEFAPFLNIMNEWYVRDTSRKIKSVLHVKGISKLAILLDVVTPVSDW